ncbi:hypothetical protein C7H19_03325 [Aphanothece hegewaldii CCALA 016]|uniref:Putative restriction endonuclease domain-containing protein n=2 Tax=Aphanothece TaxID=1121 RepID=A0A2T1M380_9CHRO|nr:hypothetical protein C7H19_03325 [Aphanothece hegewaldii CCALA 016]
MTDDELCEFCQINRDLRIERTAEGAIVIMPPTGSETGGRNFSLTGQLAVWVERDGTGKGFDSNTGFILPNKAMRSPDVSWIKKKRWEAIPHEQRQKFAPICPDFVVELRSQTDSLKVLQKKMQEYLDNGALLCWLIDPIQKKVYIYRPDAEVVCLNNPKTLSGEPILSGFVLDLSKIWD